MRELPTSSIEETLDVTELGLEFIVLRAEFEYESLIVVALGELILGEVFTLLHIRIVLLAAPGEKITTGSQSRHPAGLQE